MIFHPGIIALLLGSTIICLMLCYAAYEGVQIIRFWQLNSGSEHQLRLERKTYLISTFLTYVMALEVFSLFLFIYTADSLSHLFVGAMCAAGSLNVNSYGYPTVLVKMVNCLLAGLWLVVNYTDNQAPDYPLIRVKYVLLLVFSPLLLLEAWIQSAYLLQLEPNLITSCCSVIFDGGGNSLTADLAAMPVGTVLIFFALVVLACLATGAGVYFFRRMQYLFAATVLIFLPVALETVISVVSVYIYELPTHHCPFCILHGDYYGVGYLFYFLLLSGGIGGLGVGALQPFRRIGTLVTIVPNMQRRLALLCMFGVVGFTVLAVFSIIRSNLTLI